MKKTFKRIFASLMVAVMVLSAAPLSGFAGLDLRDFGQIFSTKAEAADERMLGDTNDDGKINSTDALLILQSSCGKHISSDEELYYGDIDKNAEVTAFDALLVLKLTIGEIINLENWNDYFVVPQTKPALRYETTLEDGIFYVSGYVASGKMYALDLECSFSSFLSCTDIDIPYYGGAEMWSTNVDSDNSKFKISICNSDGVDSDNRIFTVEFDSSDLSTVPTFDFIAYDCDREIDVTGTEFKYDYTYILDENSDAIITGYNGEVPSELVIPSTIDGYTVVAIGDSAFYDCDSLTSVTIGGGVKNIGNQAFRYCGSLANIEIPNSVVRVGDRTFESCESLTGIDIPNSIKTIGEGAFGGCINLTSIEIPDGVETVGEEAFGYCINLTSISISASVTELGLGAFAACHNINEITVDPENTKYIVDEKGVLYNIDKTELILYPARNTETEYRIPDTVSVISHYAFYGASKLENVTIPHSVKHIYGAAFEGAGLTNVFIPNSVQTIYRYAFSGCLNLTEAVLEEGIVFIDYSGMNIFAGCDNLKKVKIPNSITYINEEAFRGCDSLESVEIGNGVELINWGAFQYCDSLTDVYYNGTEEEWNQIDIREYNEPLLNATIHFLGDYGFTYELDENNEATITGYNGEVPSELVIPSTIDGYKVVAIGFGAFAECDEIVTVTIPDSVTHIASSIAFTPFERVALVGAFSLCLNLTEFIVDENNQNFSNDENGVLFNKDKTVLYRYPLGNKNEKYSINDSVNLIYYGAFAGCAYLKSIEVDEDNNYYFSNEDGVLFNKDKTKLICYPAGRTEKSYSVPDTVKNISACAFVLSNITSVDIGNSVTVIDTLAFLACAKLATVAIGNNVTHIDIGSFANCSSLKTLTIGDGLSQVNLERIDAIAFIECNELLDVYFHGTEEEWNEIEIEEGNECLLNANIHFLGDYGFTYELDENNDAIITGYNGEVPSELVIPSAIDGYTVVAIGGNAFTSCYNITNVTIADTVKSVGEEAFWDCTGLTDVIIGDGVTSIGFGAFVGCENLTSLPIGSNVKTIGGYAFGNCHGLTEVVIPDGVESIGTLAFITCNNLTSVRIPASVTEIGESPFGGSYNLENITVDENNPNYCSYENVLFDKDKTVLIQYAGDVSDTEYVIPDTVETIGIYSFVFRYNIEKVTIPDSVKHINSGAFMGCFNLKEVTIGNGVEVIEYGAFAEIYDEDGGSITDVYYYGTEEEWNEIEIEEGNECLLNANIHFLGEHQLTHFTIPSTCKVQGMEYDLCSHCGETFNVKVLPLADHTWGKWEVVREATTELEGLKQRKCSVCGTTEDELIPKLKVLIDDESGIIIEYEDEYDDGVEIVVEETYDGNSFQLIDLNYGNNQAKIFDISTVRDGEKVQPEGKVKVRIPLPEGFGTKNIFVCYVDSINGTVKNIPAKVVNGYIEFEAEHFSYYAVVEKLGKVNSISINDVSMNYKDSATITPTINVDNDVKYTVSYSSSDTGVAQVDANGKVTASGTGNATITVTVTDEYGNTVTDTCNVNVTYKWWQWIIVIVLFGWIWY